MTEPAKKEAVKKRPTGESPKAVFNVTKVGKKGNKAPRQIVVTRENVQCVGSEGVTWTLPNGGIIRFCSILSLLVLEY